MIDHNDILLLFVQSRCRIFVTTLRKTLRKSLEISMTKVNA